MLDCASLHSTTGDHEPTDASQARGPLLSDLLCNCVTLRSSIICKQSINASCLQARVRKHGRQVDARTAWAAVEDLLADGHRPTVKTYTAVMCILGDVGTPVDARRVLEHMTVLGEKPDIQVPYCQDTLCNFELASRFTSLTVAELFPTGFLSGV